MKKKNLLSGLILLGALVMFGSCKKEQMQPATSKPTTASVKKVAAADLLSQETLSSFSKIPVGDYKIGAQLFSEGNNATELMTPYLDENGNTVFTLVVADLGLYSESQLGSYLSGVDYELSSSDPLRTSLVLVSEGAPRSGFLMGQYSGDPVSMALSSGNGTRGLFSSTLSLSDNSFVKAYEAEADQSIAGWNVFDATTQQSTTLLLVSNRFAVYVTGSITDASEPLINQKRLLSQFDFQRLERLAAQ